MAKQTYVEFSATRIGGDLFRTFMACGNGGIGDYTFSDRRLINQEFKFHYFDLRNKVSATFLPKMEMIEIEIGTLEDLKKSLEEIGSKLWTRDEVAATIAEVTAIARAAGPIESILPQAPDPLMSFSAWPERLKIGDLVHPHRKPGGVSAVVARVEGGVKLKLRSKALTAEPEPFFRSFDQLRRDYRTVEVIGEPPPATKHPADGVFVIQDKVHTGPVMLTTVKHRSDRPLRISAENFMRQVDQAVVDAEIERQATRAACEVLGLKLTEIHDSFTIEGERLSELQDETSRQRRRILAGQ